jgi:hypothetical protein
MRRWTVRAGRDLKAMASQIHEAYDYIDFEDVRSEPYGTPERESAGQAGGLPRDDARRAAARRLRPFRDRVTHADSATEQGWLRDDDRVVRWLSSCFSIRNH